MSDPKNALILLKDALEKDYSNVSALADMGDTLLARNEFDQAREYATECLALILLKNRIDNFDTSFTSLSDLFDFESSICFS